MWDWPVGAVSVIVLSAVIYAALAWVDWWAQHRRAK